MNVFSPFDVQKQKTQPKTLTISHFDSLHVVLSKRLLSKCSICCVKGDIENQVGDNMQCHMPNANLKYMNYFECDVLTQNISYQNVFEYLFQLVYLSSMLVQ